MASLIGFTVVSCMKMETGLQLVSLAILFPHLEEKFFLAENILDLVDTEFMFQGAILFRDSNKKRQFGVQRSVRLTHDFPFL